MKRRLALVIHLAAVSCGTEEAPPGAAAGRGHAVTSPLSCPDGTNVIVGTPGDDLLTGTDGDDSLQGGPGDDVRHGGDGSDRLFDSTGADVLHGEAGRDVMNGGGDDDLLFGGDGRDVMNGGAGDGLLDGGRGHDIVRGASGNDLIQGGPDVDALVGDDGQDALHGGGGTNSSIGGLGYDACAGSSCETGAPARRCAADADCTGGRRCEEAVGFCVFGQHDGECDDADPLTADQCLPTQGCAHPTETGAACDDVMDNDLDGVIDHADPDCPPAEPAGVWASDGEDSWLVTISWNPVANATGYRVYRDVELATFEDVADTTWDDWWATRGDVPTADGLDVGATTDQAERVRVTWSEPLVPAGPAHEYTVAAVNAAGEGPESISDSGHRGFLPVTRYEIRVDQGGWTRLGLDLACDDVGARGLGDGGRGHGLERSLG